MYSILPKLINILFFVSNVEKSKKRGRDGTPDKPMTPNASQDTMEDNALDDRRNVIINDEILALQIKPEDIQKVLNKKYFLNLNCISLFSRLKVESVVTQ